MLAPWAIEEMKTAELEDKRLNARLTALLSALGEHPTASIPAACGGFNEMTAAYRFFDNEKATWEKILAPHAEQARQRMAQQELVLLVQDTSELDFTRPQEQVVGAGSLDGSSRCGAFLHPLVAFTADGTPLGTCWAKLWTQHEPAEETRAEKEKRRKATPIEEKESFRWIEGLRQARDVAQELPDVQCVCIADSEADIYELFSEPRGQRRVEWLVRACQDRAALCDAENSDDEAHRLCRLVENQPLMFSKEISVRGRPQAKVSCETRGRRQPRDSRTAEVEVRAATVTLRPPQRAGLKLPAVTINVVLVRSRRGR